MPTRAAIVAVVLGSVLALALAGPPAHGADAANPGAAEVVARVDAARLRRDIDSLAGFGTRHTLSETASATRGIGAARRWIKAELEKASPDLVVAFEEFDAPASGRLPGGGRIVNVVATLAGSDAAAASRRYYVVGHYDSRNGDANDASGDAPGANDDASGTAVVIESARVLAGLARDQRPRATIVFLCTAGEEQGLFGARFHAEGAKARGEDIRAVLNNDIVGDPYGVHHPTAMAGKPGPGVLEEARTTVRVFSEGLPRNPSAEQMSRLRSLAGEGDSPSRQIARFVAGVARAESTALRPRIVHRQDRFLRGGDHSAFNDAGFAGVRFTVPHEDYSRQHQDVTERNGQAYGDVAAFVNIEYLADVCRLNVAALWHLANAPDAPKGVRLITASLSNDTLVRWEAAGDAAGYEVVWRATTEPDWTGVRDSGTATEARLAMYKDDWFFGVRAYDAAGRRGPVSFAGAAEK